MTQTKHLIGLTGRKGSGKDTMAQILTDRGYENLKFAGALKGMISFLLRYQGVDEETIDRMVEGDLKEVPTPYLQGKTPRWAMQSLGTEWGRELIGDSLWVDATMTRAATFERVVITDMRFPNECQAVVDADGASIRINPVGVDQDTSDLHESEAHIDHLPVDHVFDNDKSLGIEACRGAFAELIFGQTEEV